MKLKPLEHYRVNFHILTPVHIGAGRELDPFTFIIKDGRLVLIDLVKWMASFSDQDSLTRMFDSDNFAQVRSFIAEHFDSNEAILESIPVTSKELLETYHRVIREKDPRNLILIEAMTRNELSKTSYIPGSSIKGAIRTAIANQFVEVAGVTSENAKYNRKTREPDYNEKIFGKIYKDPLCYLKLSDISLSKHGSVIVEAKEYPLNPNKSPTPKGYKEVATSLCQSGENVVYPSKVSMAPFQLHRNKVDVQFMIEALNSFYLPKYSEEYSKFYGSSDDIGRALSPANRAVAKLKTNEALVRIGHFSHAECVTLDGVRRPVTRKKAGRPLPWGTTRTLANGLVPFGWVKLEFLDINAEDRPAQKWPFSLEDRGHYFPVDTLTAEPSAETKAPRVPITETPVDPEKVRKEKLEQFQSVVNQSTNIAGQIDDFINRIRAQEDSELKKEMCEALLKKAKGLPKKKKYSAAVSQGKAWALKLRELCEELGIADTDISK